MFVLDVQCSLRRKFRWNVFDVRYIEHSTYRTFSDKCLWSKRQLKFSQTVQEQILCGKARRSRKFLKKTAATQLSLSLLEFMMWRKLSQTNCFQFGKVSESLFVCSFVLVLFVCLLVLVLFASLLIGYFHFILIYLSMFYHMMGCLCVPGEMVFHLFVPLALLFILLLVCVWVCCKYQFSCVSAWSFSLFV